MYFKTFPNKNRPTFLKKKNPKITNFLQFAKLLNWMVSMKRNVNYSNVEKMHFWILLQLRWFNTCKRSKSTRIREQVLRARSRRIHGEKKNLFYLKIQASSATCEHCWNGAFEPSISIFFMKRISNNTHRTQVSFSRDHLYDLCYN